MGELVGYDLHCYREPVLCLPEVLDVLELHELAEELLVHLVERPSVRLVLQDAVSLQVVQLQNCEGLGLEL